MNVDETVTHWIGRSGATVPDPFDSLRPVLKEHATGVDDAATWHGLALAGSRDRESLLQLRREVESELTSLFDSERAARAAAASDREVELWEQHDRAREDRLVLEGKARSTIGTRPALDRDLADAHHRADVAWTEALGSSYYDSEGNFTRDHLYVEDWLPANGKAFSHLVAIDRELAIFEELERPESERQRLPDGAPFKEIGSDAPVLLAERRMFESGWSDRLGRSVPRISIYREDFPEPPMLDPSYDALGSLRRADLVRQLQPLGGLALIESDDGVRARHEKLSAQPVPALDRGAAQKVARLETMVAIVSGDRDLADANAALLEAEDPARAAVEAKTAAGAQAKLDGLESQLEHLRGTGAHPDVWVQNEDHRGRVWAREAQIRERMDVEVGMRHSLERPSRHLLARLGPQPEPGTPGHATWRELGGRLETERLTAAAAQLDGREPPARDPQAIQNLNQEIDSYRAEVGLQPGGGQEQMALARDGGHGIC